MNDKEHAHYFTGRITPIPTEMGSGKRPLTTDELREIRNRLGVVWHWSPSDPAPEMLR